MLSVVAVNSELRLVDTAYVPKEHMNRVLSSGSIRDAHTALGNIYMDMQMKLDEVTAQLVLASNTKDVCVRTSAEYDESRERPLRVVLHVHKRNSSLKRIILDGGIDDFQKLHSRGIRLATHYGALRLYLLDQENPISFK